MEAPQTTYDIGAYQGFSGSHQEFDEAFFHFLVRQYSASVIELAIDRFGESLAGDSSSVLELLSSLDADSPYEIFWSPGVASVFQSLRRGDERAARRGIAQFLLYAGSKGLIGDWSIELEEPAVFWWDAFVLPEARALHVRHRGQSVRLSTASCAEAGDGFLFEWDRAQGGWSTASDLKRLAVAKDGDLRVVLLSQDALPALTCGVGLVPETSEEHARPIEKSLRLLKEHSPRYHQWVSRVLRNLIIVQAPEHHLQSGNFDGTLGMFYISHCDEPLLVAEMLVHECSHQYYHALVQLEEVADPSDTRTYYSPFVQKQRPLERILVAYHAFANVYLFYRDFLDSGYCAPEECVGLKELIEDLGSVEKVMVETDKLTTVGRALADPLYRERHRCPAILLA